MAIIQQIGSPENDSVARAIKRFGKDLRDDYFVFHNFEVTTGRGLRYDYDARPLPPRGQRLPRRDPRQPAAVDLRERRRLPQPDPASQQEDRDPGRKIEAALASPRSGVRRGADLADRGPSS